MKKRYLMSFEDQTSALDYINGDTTLMFPHVSIVGDGEVVYSKEIPNNKNVKFAKDETTGKLYFIVDGVSYVAVDLGLPSGTMWADKNVGAETPQDSGLYFDWGNVDGHTVDENGNVADGYSFDQNTYSTTLGGQYTDIILDTEHDAARVNMGDEWRMPKVVEIQELCENTDQYYIGEDGNIVDKSELSSSKKLCSICFVKKGEEFNYNDRSNFIEFPFAGMCVNSLLYKEGMESHVWSNALNSSNAVNLFLSNDGTIFRAQSRRYYGQFVRGVLA